MLQKWLVWMLLLKTVEGITCPHNCKCNAYKTDCSSKELITLPDNLDTKVENLNLSYNHIDTIPVNISALGNLKTLNLHHNRINVLGRSSLRGLLVLQNLDLRENSFSSYTDVSVASIEPTKALFQLDISHNTLKGFPLLRSSSLNIFKLRNCSITALHSNAFRDLENITKIDMGENKISNVPPNLQSPTLKYLDLGYNFIRLIHAQAFEQTSKLLQLSLTNNKYLTRFNAMSLSLGYLDISYCNFNRLPEAYLPNLTYLDMRGNSATKLEAESFKNMSNIVVLKLSSNFIQHIDNFAFNHLKKVKIIDLSYNLISVIDPYAFKQNQKLEHLLISHNYLKELVKFNINSLVHLDVSECEISELRRDSLLNMPSLTHLNLSRNVISTIPNNLSSKSLEDLDLALCRITNLRNETFIGMPSLKRLHLNGNRLVEIKRSFLHNVLILELADNAWRCDCKSNDFKQLFSYLERINKSDVYELTCQSPEKMEGKFWHDACAEWFVIDFHSRDRIWVYCSIAVLLLFLVTLIAMYNYNKLKKQKQRRLEELRQLEREENRERLRRMRMEARLQQEAERNAPDPRELERPPSYGEAMTMARQTGSCTSIASKKGSKTSLNSTSSKRNRTRTKRKRRKSKAQSENQLPRLCTESSDTEPSYLSVESIV